MKKNHRKVKTLGMIDVAKLDPTLTDSGAIKNYTFVTKNGVDYLIANTVVGDESYEDDTVFAAGEYLNGWALKAWEGQTLIVDKKHIEETYADISVTSGSETLLVVDTSTAGHIGELKKTNSAPASGIYFKCVKKCRLTEEAVEVQIIVVDQDTTG